MTVLAHTHPLVLQLENDLLPLFRAALPPLAAAAPQVLAIAVVVTKNSGGAATYGKIAAARHLGLPVLMIARPALPPAEEVATAEEMLRRLG